jgi:outer membrane receptor protein involved in Fe transport
VRSLHFDDRINEKSVIETPDLSSNGARERIVVDSLRDRASYDEMQTGIYLQDAVDVLPQRDRLIVTGGVRADYFTFNDEWTVSPRLSTRLKVNERLTLTGSWGLYHQKPTYRELRGTLNGEQGINDALNRDVRSQELMQTVLGGEYFFPDRRLYLRVEGYYKDIDNVISYTIEDIRVNYSGFNDARAHIYGVDLQLRGEFVPGLESWFNYSYMVARERFYDSFQDDYNRGLIPRPTDQRHTFSAFVQDYVPGDKTWKLHMRMLYGSGLPYTPPINGPENDEGVRVRQPGPRMSGRLPAYRRVDIGATKEIEITEATGSGAATPVKLNLTLEVLNLFDMDNTVAYTWEGDWSRVPKRLTPRTLNARVRLTF